MGIDRDLEAKINQLSQDVLDFNKNERELLIGRLADRYTTLRSVMLLIIVLSLVIIGFTLYGTLRTISD